MFKFIRNPFSRRMREASQRIFMLEAELEIAKGFGEAYENANRKLRTSLEQLSGTVHVRTTALMAIVESVDAITTPNGTLRKVRRLADEALQG